MISDAEIELRRMAIEIVTFNPIDKHTWAEWVQEFKIGGIWILDDQSGFMDSKVLTASEARAAIGRCNYERVPPPGDEDDSAESHTVEVVRPAKEDPVQSERRLDRPPVEVQVLPVTAEAMAPVIAAKAAAPKSMTVGEWRRMYDHVSKNPPVEGFIKAEEGMIRMEVELHPGKPPFIFTRLYIRNIVGVEPAWFAQGEKQTNSYGWKVVLLPKSRDEVIKRLGVTKNVVFVDMIRVIKMSETKRSLLGEVVQW